MRRHSWASLPPELLFLILEPEPAASSAAASRRAHRQLLLVCALVCKTWADIAQTVLFRHIHVEHTPEYRNVFTRLVSTLSYLSHTKRFLPLATRTLAVDVGDHWLPHGKTCTHADTPSVALAVHLCPRLAHLRLHVREGVRHSFSESSLALLRTTRTVTKLSISADSSPMLPQLLHVWPQLTFLDSRTSSGFPSPVTPAALPARCAIRELHASGTAPDGIAALAAPFACSLRALTLVSHQRTGAPPTRALFDGSVPLPALESATLDCEFDARTLDALPSGIAHLGLVFWDTALFAVLRAFVSRRSGTLKALSLLAPRVCSANGTTGRGACADESGLLDLCAQNGITVRYRTREELVTSGATWC